MGQTYAISEIYGGVVQGEGLNAGRPCSVLRMSGCNLWRNPDKPSTTCPWCDTPNLHHAEVMVEAELLHRLAWVTVPSPAKVGLIITGGEPMLQLTDNLLTTLCAEFAWVDLETNGTVPPALTPGLLWELSVDGNLSVSCSPKSGVIVPDLPVRQYKVLLPDKMHLMPLVQEHQRRYAVNGSVIFVQPVEVGGVDSPQTKSNIQACVTAAAVGGFRLSVQMHKYLNIR